jgi:hypothetical protein
LTVALTEFFIKRKEDSQQSHQENQTRHQRHFQFIFCHESPGEQRVKPSRHEQHIQQDGEDGKRRPHTHALLHEKWRAHGAIAFARTKGHPMENRQKGQQHQQRRNLGIYFVFEPHEQKHHPAGRKHSAHGIHQPARFVAVRVHEAEADAHQ